MLFLACNIKTMFVVELILLGVIILPMIGFINCYDFHTDDVEYTYDELFAGTDVDDRDDYFVPLNHRVNSRLSNEMEDPPKYALYDPITA